MIYMGLWHVNDAREPCLLSIFMNNCVWGAVEMEGGGGNATRPPKSPEHKAWMVELLRPRVHMPVGMGPPVHPD